MVLVCFLEREAVCHKKSKWGYVHFDPNFEALSFHPAYPTRYTDIVCRRNFCISFTSTMLTELNSIWFTTPLTKTTFPAGTLYNSGNIYCGPCPKIDELINSEKYCNGCNFGHNLTRQTTKTNTANRCKCMIWILCSSRWRHIVSLARTYFMVSHGHTSSRSLPWRRVNDYTYCLFEAEHVVSTQTFTPK